MLHRCTKLLLLGAFLAPAAMAGDANASASGTAATYQDPYPYKGYVTPLPASSQQTVEPEKQPRKWPHRLPFFAQRIIDRGIELPPPYDVGYSYFYGYQRLRMKHLKASIGDNPVQPLDFVHFDTTKIYTQSNQFQFGAWLFPFLNVYGIFGNTRGHGDVDITFSEADGLRSVPGGESLASGITLPTQRANYHGITYGFGFTLVGHYRKIFISIPFTYLGADVTMSDKLSRSVNIAPRAGSTINLGRFGSLILYVGATYFYMNGEVSGHYDIPLENRPGETLRFNYAITEKAAGPWSGIVGVSWMINKSFNIILEKGYGYNRANVIATVFYRF